MLVYSDGACEGNPGPGGWAAILIYQQHIKELSGGSPATTNNRMELRAAVEALGALKEPCEVEFFTDSKYVQSGISEWLEGWKRRGWRTKDKQPVKNDRLWRALDEASTGHKISWNWVKGHSGHEMNERCDLLARAAIRQIRRQFTPEQLRAILVEFKRSLEHANENGELEGFD